HLGQARNQIGDARAWPWPLADGVQALLVNIDNDDWPLRCSARLQNLEEIKNADPQFLDRQRVGGAQPGKGHTKCQSNGACHAKTPGPSRDSLHWKPSVTARNNGSVISRGMSA